MNCPVIGKYYFCICDGNYYDTDEMFEDCDTAIEAAMRGETVAVLDGTLAYVGSLN